MSAATHHTFTISKQLDSIACSQGTVSYAESLGFHGRSLAEIAIAVSELVTNVVKYAGNGTLVLSPLSDGGRPGIVVVVEDDGPGIEDIDSAMLDGVSEGRRLIEDEVPIGQRRGLGAGLGAVQRLMTSVSIENKPEGGARVTAFKRL